MSDPNACDKPLTPVFMRHETRGRKRLSFADLLANVPLRLYPREIEEIKRRAEDEGITAMAWKQRAIRAALHRNANPLP